MKATSKKRQNADTLTKNKKQSTNSFNTAKPKINKKQINRVSKKSLDIDYYDEADYEEVNLNNNIDDISDEIEEPADDEIMDEAENESSEEGEEQTTYHVESDGDEDSIRYYLEEISKYKLLNAEEEHDLSKKIQAGNENALNKLINSNLRLVVKIAKHYMSPDYPLIDVIQDGNLGLIKAAKKFDYRKNVRFSTYASWWIKQTIVRSLSMRRRMIRIPHRKEEKLRKIKKAWSAYYQQYKKTPKYEDLSRIIEIPVEEIEEIMSAATPVVSYEYNINEENCTIKNLISDDSYRPEDIFVQKMMKTEANKLLDTLYPKERMILAYRYGFNNGKKYTLKKMGNFFGISAETVRQIEIKALRKLKENFTYLQDYLN